MFAPFSSASEHPTPPGPLCALLSLYRSRVGLAPTLLLDRLRLHLLMPLFLPDLLQQIVLDQPPHRGVAADPIESRLLRVSPARGERSVHPSRRAGHPSFRMVGAECH